MKKAVLLHGTDGTPNDHWFPWIKKWLESEGFDVFAPELPSNHTPNRQHYEDFLKNSGWDFKDNILIGHSSGATTILNLMSTGWFPHIKVAVLAGTFLNEKLTEKADWYEPGQFDNLFLSSYNPGIIKTKADNFVFVHGDNDPFCDVDDAHSFCEQVGGEFLLVKNGHHLGGSSGFSELPNLTEKLNSIL